MEQTKKILIADDDKLFSEALEEYFSELDSYQVCGVADNGQKTLEMIEKHSPDVVILDLVMPNLDGIGVLEKIKNMELPTTPQILFITSFAQPNVTKKAMELGAA